jgi:hypothetical protein
MGKENPPQPCPPKETTKPRTESPEGGGGNYPTPEGLVGPVGGPHSLRGVGRGDGGGREQWRREKNAQVPPVVEAKRGGC